MSTKETSKTTARLAAAYINCPEMVVRVRDGEGVYELNYLDIRKLAASCLAQREQPEPRELVVEPSVPTSKLLAILLLRNPREVIVRLQDLIGEAEKESEK